MNNQKGFSQILLISGMVAIIISLGIWFLAGRQNKNYSQQLDQAVPKQGENISTISQKASKEADLAPIDQKAEFVDAYYENPKYNFKFKYNNEYYFEKKLSRKTVITEKDNKITFKEIYYKDDGSVDEEKTKLRNQDKYILIYDAHESDKDNLYKWWSENIKTEILNKQVPQEYDFSNNFPYCPDDEAYKAPSWLTITVKPSVLNDGEEQFIGNLLNSHYAYFNFGTPFILNYTESNSGACSMPEILSTLSRIK